MLVDQPSFGYTASSQLYIRWPAVLREATIASDRADAVADMLRQGASDNMASSAHYQFRFRQELQALTGPGAAPLTPKGLKRFLRTKLGLRAGTAEASTIIADICSRSAPGVDDAEGAELFGGVADAQDVSDWLDVYVWDAVKASGAAAARHAPEAAPWDTSLASEPRSSTSSRQGAPIADVRLGLGTDGVQLLKQHGFAPVPSIIASAAARGIGGDLRGTVSHVPPGTSVADLVAATAAALEDAARSSFSAGELQEAGLLPCAEFAQGAPNAVSASLNYEAFGEPLFLFTQGAAPQGRLRQSGFVPGTPGGSSEPADICDLVMHTQREDALLGAAGFELVGDESLNEGAELTPERILLLRRQSAVGGRSAPPVIVDVLSVVYNAKVAAGPPSSTGAALRSVKQEPPLHADVDACLQAEGYVRVPGDANDGNPGPAIGIWFRRQYNVPADSEYVAQHSIVLSQSARARSEGLYRALRHLTTCLLLWEAERVHKRGDNLFNVGSGRGVLTAFLALRQGFNTAVRRGGGPKGALADTALLRLMTGHAPQLVGPVPELPLGVAADLAGSTLGMGLDPAEAVEAIALWDEEGADAVTSDTFTDAALFGWGPGRSGEVKASTATQLSALLLAALGVRLAEGWGLPRLCSLTGAWRDAVAADTRAGDAAPPSSDVNPTTAAPAASGEAPAEPAPAERAWSDSEESGSEGGEQAAADTPAGAQLPLPPSSHRMQHTAFPPSTGEHGSGSMAPVRMAEMLQHMATGALHDTAPAHPCGVAGVARDADKAVSQGGLNSLTLRDTVDLLWGLGCACIAAWQAAALCGAAAQRPGARALGSQTTVSLGATLVQAACAHRLGQGQLWKDAAWVAAAVPSLPTDGPVPLEAEGGQWGPSAAAAWALSTAPHAILTREAVMAALPSMGLAGPGLALRGVLPRGDVLVLAADLIANAAAALCVDTRARCAALLLRAGVVALGQQHGLLWRAQQWAAGEGEGGDGAVFLDVLAVLRATCREPAHGTALSDDAPATFAEVGVVQEGDDGPPRSPWDPLPTAGAPALALTGTGLRALYEEALRALSVGARLHPAATRPAGAAAAPAQRSAASMLRSGTSLWAADATGTAGAGADPGAKSVRGAPAVDMASAALSPSGSVHAAASSAAWAAGITLQVQLARSLADGNRALLRAAPFLGDVELSLLAGILHCSALAGTGGGPVQAWMTPLVSQTSGGMVGTSFSAPGSIFASGGRQGAGASSHLSRAAPGSIWAATPAGPPEQDGAAEQLPTLAGDAGEVFEVPEVQVVLGAVPAGAVSAFLSAGRAPGGLPAGLLVMGGSEADLAAAAGQDSGSESGQSTSEPSGETQAMHPALSGAHVCTATLVPISPVADVIGASMALAAMGLPEDRFLPDVASSSHKVLISIARQGDAAESEAGPLALLSGSPALDASSAHRILATVLRSGGVAGAEAVADVICGATQVTVPHEDEAAVAGAVSLADLLSDTRAARVLGALGMWPVSAWLPALLARCAQAHTLHVATAQQVAEAATRAQGAESESEAPAEESESEEGVSVVLGEESSSEASIPPSSASEESGVVSSSGDSGSDFSDAGSGVSSVSGDAGPRLAPLPDADSSSDDEAGHVQGVLVATARVVGEAATRKRLRKGFEPTHGIRAQHLGAADQASVAGAAAADEGSDSTSSGPASVSTRRSRRSRHGSKRKAARARASRNPRRHQRWVGDTAAGQATGVVGLYGAYMGVKGLVAQEHRCKVLVGLCVGPDAKSASSKGGSRRQRRAEKAAVAELQRAGYEVLERLPAGVGALWGRYKVVQAPPSQRALRRSKGQHAAEVWAKRTAGVLHRAITDIYLTNMDHDKPAHASMADATRSNGKVSSRAPRQRAEDACDAYGHVAPHISLAVEHGLEGGDEGPPGARRERALEEIEGPEWTCGGGWRINSSQKRGGASGRPASSSACLWHRAGNSASSKRAMARRLLQTLTQLPQAGPGSVASEEKPKEQPAQDWVLAGTHAALGGPDGEYVPSMSDPLAHLPLPPPVWSDEALLPKPLRKLLPRLQRHYQRLYAAGSVPLNPISLFVDKDVSESGTVPPDAFAGVLRTRMLGLGLRNEGELAALVRSLQAASCAGEAALEAFRHGKKHRSRGPVSVSRRTAVDYMLFCRLLVSPAEAAVGAIVAARTRMAILGHTLRRAWGMPPLEGCPDRPAVEVLSRYASSSQQDAAVAEAAGGRLSGRISLEDLHRALGLLGAGLSPGHMLPLVRALGLTPDSEGRVGVDAFLRQVMAGTGLAAHCGVPLLSPAAQAARSRLREAAWISTSSDLDLAAAFRGLDGSGSGTLDEAALRAGLRLLGVHLQESEFQGLLSTLDANKSGRLGFAEFVRFIEADEAELGAAHRLLFSHVEALQNAGEASATGRIRAAFAAHDVGDSSTGAIPLRSFVAACHSAGLPLTPMQIVLLARRFSLPGSQRVEAVSQYGAISAGKAHTPAASLGFDVSYSRFLAWAFGSSPSQVMAVNDSTLATAAGGPLPTLAGQGDMDAWRPTPLVQAMEDVGGGSPTADRHQALDPSHVAEWVRRTLREGEGSHGADRRGRPARAPSPLASPAKPPRLPAYFADPPTYADTQLAAASAHIASEAPGALSPGTTSRLRAMHPPVKGEAVAARHMAPRQRAAWAVQAERDKRWRESGIWVCKVCGYQNKDYARLCYMCHGACPHAVTLPDGTDAFPAGPSSLGADKGMVPSSAYYPEPASEVTAQGTAAALRSPYASMRGGAARAAAVSDPLGPFPHSPSRDMDADANRGLEAWQGLVSQGMASDRGTRHLRPGQPPGGAYDGQGVSAGPQSLLQRASLQAPSSQHLGRDAAGSSQPPAPLLSAPSISRLSLEPALSHPGMVTPQRRQDRPSSAASRGMHVGRVSAPSSVSDAELASAVRRSVPSTPTRPAVYPLGQGTVIDSWSGNFGQGAPPLSQRPPRPSVDVMDPLRASGADLAAMARRGAPPDTGAFMSPGGVKERTSRGSTDLLSSMGGVHTPARGGEGVLPHTARGPDAFLHTPSANRRHPTAAATAEGASMGMGSPGSTMRGVRPDYMALAAAGSGSHGNQPAFGAASLGTHPAASIAHTPSSRLALGQTPAHGTGHGRNPSGFRVSASGGKPPLQPALRSQGSFFT